jgi:hypothetical protein
MTTKKCLYIAGYDKQGIMRFSIPNGGSIPAGVIAGKDWMLKVEYRELEYCDKCNYYDICHCE